MIAPKNLMEFVDRGPLMLLALLMLPTLVVLVPLGFIARAIGDGAAR